MKARPIGGCSQWVAGRYNLFSGYETGSDYMLRTWRRAALLHIVF